MVHSSPAAESFTPAEYTGLAGQAGPVVARSGPSPSHRSTSLPTEHLPRPAPAPAGSRLVFHDSFSGSTLDSSKWIGCFPWAPTGCNNPPNKSLEWFTPSQATVSDGMVHITAAKEPIVGRDANGHPKIYPYRSANITTAGKFDFTYGYVQFTARFPIGRGLWSAVWMLPSNHQFPPEIDIMEIQNIVPGKVAEVFHGDVTQLGQDVYGIFGWHTYGLLWEPGSLTWYIDGVPKLHVTTEVPSQPMYLLLTLAVGGDWPGPPTAATPFPSSLEVSDVQVWQK
jgi:beta-glucanase (GH16 family)